jgi:hypothetical protein
MYGKIITSKYCLNKKSPNKNVWALNKWRRIPYVRENNDPQYRAKKKHKTLL